MGDHEPRFRFPHLKGLCRGGGCWCFRVDGYGYGPYRTKVDAARDERGVRRFIEQLKKEDK